MPNYLRAVAKTVATVAGPFGAPAEFILSIYEDELQEKRETLLNTMIAESQNLTRETLEQIFETRGEIKELREQFILGMTVCLNILLRNRQLMSTPQILESQLPVLVGQHQKMLEETGFITQETLTKELSTLYSASPDLFLTTVGMAGFPLDIIPHGKPPKVIVFQFLTRCLALELNQQFKIFSALYSENSNSEPLRVVTSLLQERVSNPTK